MQNLNTFTLIAALCRATTLSHQNATPTLELNLGAVIENRTAFYTVAYSGANAHSLFHTLTPGEVVMASGRLEVDPDKNAWLCALDLRRVETLSGTPTAWGPVLLSAGVAEATAQGRFARTPVLRDVTLIRGTRAGTRAAVTEGRFAVHLRDRMDGGTERTLWIKAQAWQDSGVSLQEHSERDLLTLSGVPLLEQYPDSLGQWRSSLTLSVRSLHRTHALARHSALEGKPDLGATACSPAKNVASHPASEVCQTQHKRATVARV